MDDFGTNNNSTYPDPLQQADPGSNQSQSDNSTISNQISTGGFSPEVVNAPVPQTEAQPQEESGYEQIKKIEKQAETSQERPERAPKPPQPVVQPKPATKPVPKSEPSKPQPKFFGYQPPKRLIANPDTIRNQVGKGNSHDASYWLMHVLNRLLQKESE